jgi:hypothetical protein
VEVVSTRVLPPRAAFVLLHNKARKHVRAQLMESRRGVENMCNS